MKKNVGSQTVSAEMVSATDGSAFTGSVSVFVTIDGGTQNAGAGTGPTHKGNGQHSYVPTQAETNGDHVVFTFTGTGAVPAGVQVYTTFPQTGDNFARLGAPAGASVSADIAAVKTETASIQTDTNDIQTRLPAALVSGRIDASVGAVAANAITAAAIATDAIDGDAIAASAVTEIQSGLATAAALQTVDDFVDTEVAAILAAVDTEVAAIKAKTDQLTFTTPNKVDASAVVTGADIDATAANKIADHIIRRTYANARASANGDTLTANSRTLLGALAKLVNLTQVNGSNLECMDEDDTTVRLSQVITTAAGADPIVKLDTS